MSGKVITFIKSGGGVGATTLAVQAACSLRGANLALLDLDIQYGSAAFQMDAESNASILDLVANPNRIDAALLRGAMVRPHDAFDLLASPEGIYPTSLRQARRQIEMTHREQLANIPLFVGANRVNGGLFSKALSQKAGEKALGRAIDFTIPNNPSIATAADAGLPLCDAKGGALAKRFARMMKEIFAAGEPARLAMEA